MGRPKPLKLGVPYIATAVHYKYLKIHTKLNFFIIIIIFPHIEFEVLS